MTLWRSPYRRREGDCRDGDSGYMSRKIIKFRTDKFDARNKREFLTHGTHVNGWEPAVYLSFMSQNFRLPLVSNLSVLNLRIFLLMYPGSLCPSGGTAPRSACHTAPGSKSRSAASAAHFSLLLHPVTPQWSKKSEIAWSQPNQIRILGPCCAPTGVLSHLVKAWRRWQLFSGTKSWTHESLNLPS